MTADDANGERPEPRGAEASDATGTCVTVFRSRLRDEFFDEYVATAEEMERLARQMPGFLAIKTFAAEDGERVSIVEFASREASAAWREQADHRVAQQLGRDKLYAEYRIQVCECVRDNTFVWPGPGTAGS